jgi:hypothetical protein
VELEHQNQRLPAMVDRGVDRKPLLDSPVEMELLIKVTMAGQLVLRVRTFLLLLKQAVVVVLVP